MRRSARNFANFAARVLSVLYRLAMRVAHRVFAVERRSYQYGRTKRRFFRFICRAGKRTQPVISTRHRQKFRRDRRAVCAMHIAKRPAPGAPPAPRSQPRYKHLRHEHTNIPGIAARSPSQNQAGNPKSSANAAIAACVPLPASREMNVAPANRSIPK